MNINNEDKFLKKSVFSIPVWVFLVLLLVVGGTFAAVIGLGGLNIIDGKYATETTCFDIDYDVTNDDGTLPISGVLFPSSSYSGGLSGNVSLKINNLCSIEGIGNLYLNVVFASDILTQVVGGHCENKVSLTTLNKYKTEADCVSNEDNIWVTAGTALKYAVFSDKSELPISVGYVDKVGSIEIYNNILVTKSLSKFYVYIWLDGELSDNSYANSLFEGTVSASAEQKYEKDDFMVNFDLNGGEFEAIDYTDVGEHEYIIPYSGDYKLEVWGAQGGSYDTTYTGGYGGYSVGTISLNTNQKLYINVGGSGESCGGVNCTANGGYNGGGAGANNDYGVGFGGGGATHIAIKSGLLSSFSSDRDSILIVAGGGGGATKENGNRSDNGGYGGGFEGTVSVYNLTEYQKPTAGTQSLAGSNSSCVNASGGFGYGGNSCPWSGGGGGGYYGGGGGYGSAGAGGSGYIGNSLLNNKAMYCYNCTTSSDASTLTYSTTDVSSTATSNYAKSGNGAARITFLTPAKNVTYNEKYGELPIPTKYGYTFVGWNTKSDGSGQFVTSDTTVVFFGEQTLYAIWEQITYQVNYNANGGSNAPSSQTKIYDQTLVLSSTEPTRSGYTFLGWSTSSTATSATFSAGGNYTSNVSTTLYAVWKINKLYLYNNGNTYDSVTGGWVVVQSSTSSSGYTTALTFNTDRMTLVSRENQWDAGCASSWGIDFSKYTTLKASVYTDGVFWMYVVEPGQLYYFNQHVIRSSGQVNSGWQEVSINISDLTSGHIAFHLSGTISRAGHIYSVWME